MEVKWEWALVKLRSSFQRYESCYLPSTKQKENSKITINSIIKIQSNTLSRTLENGYLLLPNWSSLLTSLVCSWVVFRTSRLCSLGYNQSLWSSSKEIKTTLIRWEKILHSSHIHSFKLWTRRSQSQSHFKWVCFS